MSPEAKNFHLVTRVILNIFPKKLLERQVVAYIIIYDSLLFIMNMGRSNLSEISFAADAYTQIRKPLLEAETLPHWCYTSSEFFQHECNKIFLKSWQFVCRVDEIPKAGNYLCFDGLGGSVILVRADDKTIKAFANSCRHRGSRLLAGEGQCTRIVCPYHSWVYDVDGSLLNTPGMEDSKGNGPGLYVVVCAESQRAGLHSHYPGGLFSKNYRCPG